jgi:hypothetical protein
MVRLATVFSNVRLCWIRIRIPIDFTLLIGIRMYRYRTVFTVYILYSSTEFLSYP